MKLPNPNICFILTLVVLRIQANCPKQKHVVYTQNVKIKSCCPKLTTNTPQIGQKSYMKSKIQLIKLPSPKLD